MSIVRHLIALRWWSVLLCMAALAMKLAVPTGYMVVAAQGMPAIAPCPGQQAMPAPGAPMAHGMAHHADPRDHGAHRDAGEHGKAAVPCAFAALSAGVIAAVDPVLLALLVAFVLAVGFASQRLPTPFAARHLRPPPRGPPVFR